MSRRSDPPRPDWDGIRERFLGLNESLSVKSYYPQLREQLRELAEERHRAKESEARLLAAFLNLPFAFWSVSASGVIELVNEIAQARYGMAKGLRIEDLPIGDEQRRFLIEDISRCLSGTVVRVERSLLQEGNLLWLQFLRVPISIEGTVMAALGIDVDITELKRAEKALSTLNSELEGKVAERTARLEASISELKAAQDKLVYSEKLAALGRVTAGVAHELNSPLGAIESSSAALLEGINRIALDLPELYLELGDEAFRTFCTLLRITLGRVISLDSTGDRRRIKELRTRFAAIPIENPDSLAEAVEETGLHGEIDSLLSYFGPQKAGRIFRALSMVFATSRSTSIIHYASERASQVVRTLKSFEINELPDDNQALSGDAISAVDIDGELRATIDLYRGKMTAGLELTVHLFSHARVLCDGAAMSQVWVNLINNALQAMSLQGQLGVGSHVEGNRVIVEISDTGCGISEENRSRIFDPFFTTKPLGEGTGFGLAVAKRIVERSGGFISFESRPGRTVFRVDLPTMAGESAR